MPIGTGNGTLYKDAFEAEVAEFNRMPPASSMLDNNEIHPDNSTDKVFYPDDTPRLIPVADAGETDISTISRPQGLIERFAKYDQKFSSDVMWTMKNLLTNPEPEFKEAGKNLWGALTGTKGDRYKTWPEQAVIDVADSVDKLATGKVDPSSPEGVEAAFNVASSMVFGPATFGAKIPAGAVGSFAGVKAKLPADKLTKAKEMIDEGIVDPETLWKETGFFRGEDGKLRYEIPDRDAKLLVDDDRFRAFLSQSTPNAKGKLPFATAPLDKVLKHDALFEAYPEMRKIRVKYDPNLTNAAGSMDLDRNILNVAPGYLRSPSVILHELQHWIQDKEGFAAGGAPAQQFAMRFEKELEEAQKIYSKYAEVAYNEGRDKLTPEQNKEFTRAAVLLDMASEREAIAPGAAKENYIRLAGEVEARNVQKRWNNQPVQANVKEVEQAFKEAGIAVDTTYGWNSNDNGYKLREWKGTKEIDPATLPDELYQKWLDLTIGRRPSNIFPLKTQDIPVERQIFSDEPTWTTAYGATKDLKKAPESMAGPGDAAFPPGYLDKVGAEQRLSRKGISHPGFRWEVYDKDTGEIVRKGLETRSGASRSMDRLDNQYGRYKYRVRRVAAKENQLTESEKQFLKDNDIEIQSYHE